MAKVARARWRRPSLVALVLVPLWASYLVKAYAWRAILGRPGGVLDSDVRSQPRLRHRPRSCIVLAYLWLPYMVLPIYAGLERLPDSLLEASGDLGAGRSHVPPVVLPMLIPSIVAGSIFTFSLSLGDYIAVGLVGGKTQMIGSVVYANFSTNLPFAAAYATRARS